MIKLLILLPLLTLLPACGDKTEQEILDQLDCFEMEQELVIIRESAKPSVTKEYEQEYLDQCENNTKVNNKYTDK